MRPYLLLLVWLFFCQFIYAQIVFEPGYIIDQNGNRTNCLIKNVDWNGNPRQLTYKWTESAEVQTANPETLQGFGLEGGRKYLSFFVQIDRSSERLSSINENKNPEFKEEQLFLNVLLEGEASLFFFEDGRSMKYFYRLKDNEVKQLIFKNYLSEEQKILENNAFRFQLWENLPCEVFSLETLNKVEYRKNDLLAYFKAYNDCKGVEYTQYSKPPGQQSFFNLYFRPGLRWSSLSTNNSVTDRYDVDFGNQVSTRFGLEFEFVLPFNKRKWAVIIEPTYQHFQAETSAETELVKASYQSILTPAGLRHYFFLNQRNKVFLDVFYTFDFQLDSKLDYERFRDLEISSKNSFGLGMGYNYNDRLSVELRYYTKRDLLENYAFWTSDYKSIAFIVGYRFL